MTARPGLTPDEGNLRTNGPPDDASQPNEPIVTVRNLVKHYAPRHRLIAPAEARPVRAVDDVSFDVHVGETVGIVGESGCGKSTTARLVVGLERATGGEVWFQGVDIAQAGHRQLRSLWRDLQLVFQDPYASLNPRLTIRSTVAEPLRLAGMSRTKAAHRVDELLTQVGLSPQHASRYPGEFSGGQRQRIAIARALALQPKLVVLDEPVSALDVSVQAQVLNLLRRLQRELGLTYIFISHDLSVVRYVCDRVAVMYMGQIVEMGTRQQIFERPTHPYTQALLSAIPVPNPSRAERSTRIILSGDVPSPSNPPSGCRFRTRCWKAERRCEEQVPALVDRPADSHPSACHFAATREEAPVARASQ